MKLKVSHKGIGVIYANGNHKRYSLVWFGLPVLLLAVFGFAILFQSQDVVRHYVRKVMNDPSLFSDFVDATVHVNQVSHENLAYSIPDQVSSQLPTIKLYTPNNTLLKMQKALRLGDPELNHEDGGDKPYFNSVMSLNGEVAQEVEISLRGTAGWHHGAEKPSVRVKIKKEQVRRGRRYWELSRPEDLLAMVNFVPDHYARKMGLVADISDHVRLYVNNKYFGVYLRTMRQGAPLALMNNRTLGTFFKGDFGDGMWESTDGWSINGEGSPEDLALFNRMLAELKLPPSAANVEQLARSLDMNVYAKWAAVCALTGSHHTDAKHNQSFFIAGNQGFIEPVPWDFNSFYMYMEPDFSPDYILHPIMDRVTRDPRWVHQRNAYMYQWMNGAMAESEMFDFIDASVNRMLPDLQADVNLSSVVNLEIMPWSVVDIEPTRQELKQWITKRYETLAHYFSDSRIRLQPSSSRSGWLEVQVVGSAAIEVQRKDGQAVETNSDPVHGQWLYPGLTESQSIYAKFINRTGPELNYASPAPMSYQVKGKLADLFFTNAFTGEAATIETGEFLPTAGGRTIHPSEFSTYSTEDVVFGPGDVHLREDVITNKGQRLIIKAGTTIRLDAGVGIYSRGQTLVQGELGKRVVLEPAEKGVPWGAFGVSGEHSAGSSFSYMDVAGGSIGTDGNVRYKGMFNVYDCDEVTLNHCRFGENFVGDDTVNLAESNVTVTHCEFRDALSDALDMDMCVGEVSNSTWYDSGNDGLDMMTCEVRVKDCAFYNSGDKGISVGEDTKLYVEDTLIDHCAIGSEIKDHSTALYRNVTFTKNQIAIHAYQKKWWYNGGGTGAFEECIFEGSALSDFTLIGRSAAYIVDPPELNIANGQSKIFTVETLDATWEQLRKVAQ